MCWVTKAIAPRLPYELNRSEWYWDEPPHRSFGRFDIRPDEIANFALTEEEEEEVFLQALPAQPGRAPPKERAAPIGMTSPKPAARVPCIL